MDAKGIDHLAALLTEALGQAAVDRREILRLRLATEDILAVWQHSATDGATCKFRCGTRWGRAYIELLVPGQRVDPSEATEIGENEALLYSNLLAQAGLAPVYSYQDGMNRLAFYPQKPQQFSPLAQLLLAIAASAVCSLFCIAAPDGVRNVALGIITPLFNALMGILQTLAGPMIFLSVCCGIVNIGDVQTLGKIGKTILLRFLVAIYLLAGITAGCVVWLFKSGSSAAAGSNAAVQIYNMVLGIIPSNLFSPFLEGNSLQIIFMAVCIGAALLVLGRKADAIRVLFDHTNTVIQFLMELVSRYIAVFVFVSLVSMSLSQTLSGLRGVVKGLALGIAACLIWPLLYALTVSIRMKVSYPMLLRKLLPTYLIALSTASSSAALSTNLETCEKHLGISEHVAGFAVPLGQVIFKTGGAVGFFILALGLAEFYGVAMPLSWVVTAVIVSGLLAIATPPVPGGGLTCYTVLLTQLGIPDEAIGLAVAGNMILEFFATSCGISCLQSELVLASNRLGLLDKDKLKRKV